jgi:DNA-binding transcriptional LysR family regulator
MTDDKDTELADKMAEAGRRLGQAVTDALDRLRSARDAVAEVANRPEVRAFTESAASVLRHRPCLCMCGRAHPDDRGICEMLDAVITGRSTSELIGEIEVPLCAPCAAARAVHGL